MQGSVGYLHLENFYKLISILNMYVVFLIHGSSALFTGGVDWLQFLKQFFINVSYHILVASLTLMALS